MRMSTPGLSSETMLKVLFNLKTSFLKKLFIDNLRRRKTADRYCPAHHNFATKKRPEPSAGPGPKVTRLLSAGHLGGPAANNAYYDDYIRYVGYKVISSHCRLSLRCRIKRKPVLFAYYGT